MAAGLDTLQIVKRLKEAGFDEPQAEAVTGVIRDLRDQDFSQLAAKADIERIEALIASESHRLEAKIESESHRLEAKIESESHRLEAKIAEGKAEIIRWVFGIAFAQAALIMAILRLFPGGHL